MTYGDGLSDVNIEKLLKFHKKNNALATLTAVHPPVRFGEIKFNKNDIKSFIEKPQVGVGWINGGFFVLNRKIFNYISGKNTVFEKEPMSNLAKKKKLFGYKHEGFWQCMDTVRDKNYLRKIIKDTK
jgi:glucose-1-phosphate cytidylyltransferase